MELKNYNTYFFLLLLVIVGALTFYIFRPFLVALVLAAVAAAMFQGFHARVLSVTKGKKGLSAFVTSLAILLTIIIPLAVIIGFVVGEIGATYSSIANYGDFYQRSVEPIVARIQQNPLYHSQFIQQALSRESFMQYASQSSRVALGLIQNTYLGIMNLVFLVFVMFFSLYYLLKDGKNLIGSVLYISPLRDSHEKLLVSEFISISRATIKGALVIGFLQGLVGGIAFSIAGVSPAAAWGVLIAIFSLIPMVGAAIIWLPVALFLLLMGHVWQAVLIIAVGFGVMSVLDNVLKPRLVGKDTQMHPLLVFFATLGGLSLFGFVGFVIGPVIVALFVSMLKIYGMEFNKQLKKYNA